VVSALKHHAAALQVTPLEVRLAKLKKSPKPKAPKVEVINGTDASNATVEDDVPVDVEMELELDELEELEVDTEVEADEEELLDPPSADSTDEDEEYSKEL
jgi:hypothetical protein